MCWPIIVSPKSGVIFHIAETTMNGERYKNIHVLTIYVVPHLNQRRNQDLLFQQDDAPAHYASIVREYLNKELRGRWIGHRGSIEWPPRSPDLSPTFGCGETFATDSSLFIARPRNLTELRSRLEHLLQSISIETIERADE